MERSIAPVVPANSSRAKRVGSSLNLHTQISSYPIAKPSLQSYSAIKIGTRLNRPSQVGWHQHLLMKNFPKRIWQLAGLFKRTFYAVTWVELIPTAITNLQRTLRTRSPCLNQSLAPTWLHAKGKK